MADDTTQRALHRFLAEHLQTLEPFTKKQIQDITGWADKALATYWSKQFKGIVEQVGDTATYRVKERFRQYLDWKKFKGLVTQVKVTASYEPTVFDTFVAYEFYLPLAHENALKGTLDSLFYKDVILPRLNRIGAAALREHFPAGLLDADPDPDDRVYGAAIKFVESKFGGYSIYHVDGRFRAGDLLTQQEATDLQKIGQRYLVDETTAVVRFIFPCRKEEADIVRFLFKELFIDTITEQVSGEDEIWVVESGMSNRVHKWKPGEQQD
jgi:hypothetical protein